MIGTFLSDASNQRKIAVALCSFLALFSNKLPFLASVNPEIIVTLLAVVAGWILQSGAKAAVQAHADGKVSEALIANSDDAIKMFNHLALNPSNALQPIPTAPIAAAAVPPAP